MNIEELLKNLAEQFLKMMEFNNHLLEENLKLMKENSELKHPTQSSGLADEFDYTHR